MNSVFRPDREPGGNSGDTNRSVGWSRHTCSRRQRGAGSEQERDTDDVVVRAAGLCRAQHRQCQAGRRGDKGDGRESERATDAPRGQQREREKGEVHEWREDVAAHEHHPERMQQRRGSRVERGERRAIEIVHVGHRRVLHEAGRDGQVIPVRVDVRHAVFQRRDSRRRPRGNDHGDGNDADDEHRPIVGRGRDICGVVDKLGVCTPPPRGRAGNDGREHDRYETEDAQGAEQLSERKRQRKPDDARGENCRRTGPLVQETAPYRTRRDRDRRGENGEQRDTKQVAAQRHGITNASDRDGRVRCSGDESPCRERASVPASD